MQRNDDNNMDIENSQNNMQVFAKQMSICMGIMMSSSLTFIGLLGAGNLSFPSFILNFVISFTVISVVGRFFDAGKISLDILQKHDIDPHSMKGRIMQALITDLIYSPIMTFIMTLIGYFMATRQGVQISYFPMFFKALITSVIAAFFLCLIFTPIFEKLIMKRIEKQQ